MEIAFRINELLIKNKKFKICENEPLIFGAAAEEGTIGFFENRIYRKFGNNDTDWEIIFPERIRTISSDQNLTNSDNIILIDASNNPITINLIQGSATYLSKKFTFKVLDASNSITIQAFSGDSIENNTFVSLNSIHETLELVLIENNKWIKILTNNSLTSSSSNFNPIVLTTSNYNAQANDLIIVSYVPTTIVLPSSPTIGDRIAIKDTQGISNDPTKRILINRNTKLIEKQNSNLELKEKFCYLELVFTGSNNWSIVNKSFSDFSFTILNNDILDFTSEFGIYKLVNKNNFLDEVTIFFDSANLNLIVKNFSNLFTNIKDTANKLNIYIETSILKIQNLTGFDIDIEIKKI